MIDAVTSSNATSTKLFSMILLKVLRFLKSQIEEHPGDISMEYSFIVINGIEGAW